MMDWSRVCATALAFVAVACSRDSQEPARSSVVFTYPVDGQLDVPLGARIFVTFAEPVDAGALWPCTGAGAQVSGALCLLGPDGVVDATAEIVGDGRTVELTQVALAPGTTFELRVDPTLAPTADNLPSSGPLLRFTTRNTQPREAVPTLVAIDGAPPTEPEGFRPLLETSTLQLVFSEPLDPRTVVLGPGALELIDTTTGAAVPATLLTGGIHVSIDPLVDLVPGRDYELRVGGQITDESGDPISALVIPLTPRGIGAEHPTLEVLRTRQPGDTGATTHHAGVENNLISIAHPLIGATSSQVQPSALVAELGDTKALGGPMAFTIRRGQRLKASGLDVALGGEVPAGLATGDIEIELLSDATGRMYRNPYQPAERIPDNTYAPVFVDLSMDVAVFATDAEGNAVLTQTVLGLQASGVAIATAGVLDIEAVIAMDLDLLGLARAPTNLVLELVTDPAAQADVDRDPPSLLASLPAADGELAVDGSVEVVFSEPMDLDRARRGGLRLETEAGQEIPTVVTSHGAAVALRPLAPLAPTTAYRVVMSDITDQAGNPLGDTAPWRFTTRPAVATGVPMNVESIHPGAPCALTGGDETQAGRCIHGGPNDDAYRAFTLAADQPIEITFTQPLAPSSIVRGTTCGTGTVQIEELGSAGACTAAVPGTLTRRERAISFVPDQPWRPGARYRLRLVSGTSTSCAPGQVCGKNGAAASFDPLAGNRATAAGGPDLIVEFKGAAATGATLVTLATEPSVDANGSGFVEAGELVRDGNRAALRITGHNGVVTAASFDTPDCVAETPEPEACMYLSGTMVAEMLPAAHDCPMPGGASAPTCVPVRISPQAVFATSLPLKATALIDVSTVNISTVTGMIVMRLREPAAGPLTGAIVDEEGVPTLVMSLALYIDAPDMNIPLMTHDLHSRAVSVVLRGPLDFLPDGRIAIRLTNVGDIPLAVRLSADNVEGTVDMLVPAQQMKLQLVSQPLRGQP
jgi:Bacterial Ig-like domain